MTPWNHNIHYQPRVLDALPAGVQRVLDVGCGEGILTRRLRERIPHVTGIDLDARQIELARAHDPESDIEYVHGDVFTYPLAPASFDAVVSIATLHHLGTEAGLDRMRELLRPGGTLVVIGLTSGVRRPVDVAYELAGAIGTRVLKHTGARRYWEHSAPIQEPNEPTATTRRLALERLQGARYRRLVLWRYLLVWTAPATST